MKRSVFILLIAAELLAVLCGCAGRVPETVQSAPPASVSAMENVEETRSAAVCMGSVSHPVHRIVQLGFMEKAEELGYEGHILGLSEGSVQELYDCWLAGAKEYDIAGAVCWVGDDSAYEFLKELHGMGVKTVVPHFAHDYKKTKNFIDVNAHSDMDTTLLDSGDYIVKCLREKAIYSGALGFSVNGPALSHEDVRNYMSYMESTYPEYRIAELEFEGAEQEEAADKITEYIENNADLVAAIGKTGGSAMAWSTAKERTGRDDIFTMGMDYTKQNLDLLNSGDIDALICQPIYEAGYVGMELIDALINGEVYNKTEEQWHYKLENRIISKNGQGQNGTAYYYDIYERSEARFGS